MKMKKPEKIKNLENNMREDWNKKNLINLY